MLGAILLPAVLGVVSHVAYFNRGEHHLQAPTYARLVPITFVLGVFGLVKFDGSSFTAALAITSLIATSYFVGLLSSLLTYRVFLSPLNRFPGPWQAKISDLWLFSHLDRYKAFYQHEELHEKYGKYVRIGSNTLSISDPDLHDVAFGSGTKIRKAAWYDNTTPNNSLHTLRDRKIHDRRRRIWAPAFSDKAIRNYEPKVKHYNDKFVECVREHKGSVMNATQWFNIYAFDVMGALAFGKDYGMLDSGARHWALDLLVATLTAMGPRAPTWLFRLLISIPFAAGGMRKFYKFCFGELDWRVDQKSNDGDITGWLLKGYQGTIKPSYDKSFQAETRLIIIAGSDTTSAAMAFLFYELAKKPEEIKKLRDELKPLTVGEWSNADILNASHLNGCINEALRLHPPVPSGVERKTPPEGSQVGDVYIPGNTSFWMPQFVIGRDEDNYERAREFIPERWYSKPEMIKHKNAFAPFSLGAENCIGKNLAYLEMRTLTAQLVLEFDFTFAPNEDGSRVLNRSQDHFTTSAGQLDLTFTPISA